MIQAKLYFNNELPSSGAGIPVGLHDKGDVVFNGLVRNQDWWDLNFTNKNGQQARKRLFEPNANFMDPGETPSDALRRSEDKNIRIVVEVLRVFLGEQAGALEAETYSQFMELSAATLAPFAGTTVCLKVSPDPKNDKYGKIPDYKFIDSYFEGFPSTLYWSKKEKEKLQEMGIAA